MAPKQMKLIHNHWTDCYWWSLTELVLYCDVKCSLIYFEQCIYVIFISLGFYYTVRTIEMWKVEMQQLFYSEQNLKKSPKRHDIQHKLNVLSLLHVLPYEYSEIECGRVFACPHDIMLSAVSVTFYHGQDSENTTVVPVSHSHLPPPPFTCNHFLFSTSTTRIHVLTFVL